MKDLKKELQQQLKTIPSAVMQGGVMTASLWKAKAVKAQKLLSQPRVSEIDLQRAIEDLRSFK